MSLTAPVMAQARALTPHSPRRAAWHVAAFGVGALVCGRSVGGIVALVAVLGIHAAQIDWRTGRIPNRLVAAIGAACALGAVLLVVGEQRDAGEIASSAALGVVMSGALLFGVLWLSRPNAIGGGDVKLLGAMGLAIGLIAPVASALIVPVAAVVALIQTLVTGSRRVVLGPGLATGFVLAGAASLFANRLLGGWF